MESKSTKAAAVRLRRAEASGVIVAGVLFSDGDNLDT
jgi:hypothetical protein